MPFPRAGLVICAFPVAAGIIAALRGASTWLALACAAGTAAVVAVAWFVTARFAAGTRSAKPGLREHTDKAVERILAHVRDHHPAGTRRRVRDLTDPIQDAVDWLVEQARDDGEGGSVLKDTAAYIARLEKLELRDRHIDLLLADLTNINTGLEKIKPRQPNRSAP